jgi:L-rhamnose-H+ transport protein
MTPNPLLGALLHAIGACSSALCYTPQKKTRRWSWQTYWLAQASVCWLILPIVGAWLTTPELLAVLGEADAGVMTRTFLLGALYGVGGTAFGIAIRYIGFSVTYAIAIGISCVLGTLLPPLLDGKLGAVFQQTGAGWVAAGIAVAACGILVSGLAGWFKDHDLRASATLPEDFHLGKGLFFCVLAGVLSAVFGISLNEGKPIAELAAARGAGQFQGNVVYIFSCGGAFVTTAVYCLYLHLRHKTLGEYVELPAGTEKASLKMNLSMAALTGLLWYGQFFFYGLGHVRLGEKFGFTSWAIHMAMLVFFSAMAGLLLREWKGCRPRTWAALASAILVLLVAVGLLTYGNYLGSAPAAGH